MASLPAPPPPSRENGEFEEVIVLPSHSRLSPPEGQEQQQQLTEEQQQQQQRVPVVAFKENGLLKPVSGVEDLPVQQGAGQQSSDPEICAVSSTDI